MFAYDELHDMMEEKTIIHGANIASSESIGLTLFTRSLRRIFLSSHVGRSSKHRSIPISRLSAFDGSYRDPLAHGIVNCIFRPAGLTIVHSDHPGSVVN